jgi:hypothetical protein
MPATHTSPADRYPYSPDRSYIPPEALPTDPGWIGARGVAVVAPDADLGELRDMHQVGVLGVRVNLSGHLSSEQGRRGIPGLSSRKRIGVIRAERCD